jgi:phosphatidylglycerophosphate synthase/GT2 family glycosyltransferase
VAVIDNSSTDDSLDYLRSQHPDVQVFSQPNRGLCSFNEVLAELPGRVAVLLNNDIKLAADAVDPLVEPLIGTTGPSSMTGPCFMTAPLCWLFDGKTYEGLKTAVGWRWGLVQATARFPGHEPGAHAAGLTASAGAVLAVDRQKFLELGGFDPLYLPGRLEDLDFAFRGYQAGYHARYVPASVAYHKGQASFGQAYGHEGCHRLALRNTLLFQWKNLRHPLHVGRHLAALPPRILFDIARAPWARPGARLIFTRALCQALPRLSACLASPYRAPRAGAQSERLFFQRFAFARMAGGQWSVASGQWSEVGSQKSEDRGHCNDENRRDGPGSEVVGRPSQAVSQARSACLLPSAFCLLPSYPLSRFYLLPAAAWLASRLAPTRVRPWHITLAGLVAAVLAAALLVWRPAAVPWAALIVLVGWFCDRLDGALARRQQTASPRGAWLDANVDELVDLGLHLAVAAVAASLTASVWPWCWFVAFLFGKYLFMYGLAEEQAGGCRLEAGGRRSASGGTAARDDESRQDGLGSPSYEVGRPSQAVSPAPLFPRSPLPLLRAAWHLPGNADVRLHLLVAALASGWLTAELALIAIYYNLRWIARYALVLKRLEAEEKEEGGRRKEE